jgi:hypothetical protein
MQLQKSRSMGWMAVMVVTLGLILNACSNKMEFTTSPLAPAARGDVNIKKDRNDNYSIDVSIRNLAEIERIQGENTTYVVWIVTEGDEPKNIGQIQSATRGISNKLKASFQSVSTKRPLKVFVTAEKDGAIAMPGPIVVLSTDSIETSTGTNQPQ